jgi:hypothetical protein
MPFDEEVDETLNETTKKTGLKKVSSQKSIFDGAPKKPSFESFSKKVDDATEKAQSYKAKSAELAIKFLNLINDTTLKANKNIFTKEMEKELLTNLVSLSIDINNDPLEKEGMGSLALITLLFKTVLMQRDKINELAFNYAQLSKKVSEEALLDLINKKIQTLDLSNKGE